MNLICTFEISLLIRLGKRDIFHEIFKYQSAEHGSSVIGTDCKSKHTKSLLLQQKIMKYYLCILETNTKKYTNT